MQREIYEVTANDTYYGAKEAVEFGLATDIIEGGEDYEKK